MSVYNMPFTAGGGGGSSGGTTSGTGGTSYTSGDGANGGNMGQNGGSTPGLNPGYAGNCLIGKSNVNNGQGIKTGVYIGAQI